jgi:hypothetical protein
MTENIGNSSNYGTVIVDQEAVNASTEINERVSLVNRNKNGIYLWYNELQSHRWLQTLMVLPSLFLANFAMEGFNLIYWEESTTTTAFYMWVGFGSFLGAFTGRASRMLFLIRSNDIDYRYEWEESFVFGLVSMFGTGGSFYWVIHIGEEYNMSFTGTFFFMWALLTIFYFGTPLLSRWLVSKIIYNPRRPIRLSQNCRELNSDFQLSAAVGLGYAFMLGTSNAFSDNWLNFIEIDDSTPAFLSMLYYSLSFSIGFLILVIIENFFIPLTWTDDEN